MINRLSWRPATSVDEDPRRTLPAEVKCVPIGPCFRAVRTAWRPKNSGAIGRQSSRGSWLVAPGLVARGPGLGGSGVWEFGSLGWRCPSAFACCETVAKLRRDRLRAGGNGGAPPNAQRASERGGERRPPLLECYATKLRRDRLSSLSNGQHVANEVSAVGKRGRRPSAQ